MPDVYYDSPLTGQELDAALRAIPENVKRAEAASTNAEKSAKNAESWAQGGTDTREGEETNNAEYWAGQAKTSAGSAAEDSQILKDNLAAIQAIGENLTAIQNAPQAAERAEAAADSAEGDADRAEAAADRAQSIGQGALGYYAKASDLQAAHETGENGQWAIIGETDTIWVWDSDSGTWTDSGNKTDLSQYYTKEEADAELDELQKTLVPQISGADAAARQALGMVLYLYSATLIAGGWNGSDENGYSQEASVTAQDGGPPVTADTQLGIPMARPTGEQAVDEALNEALTIVNMGTSTPGEGTVTVKVWEKPETDITVFWYGR